MPAADCTNSCRLSSRQNIQRLHIINSWCDYDDPDRKTREQSFLVYEYNRPNLAKRLLKHAVIFVYYLRT